MKKTTTGVSVTLLSLAANLALAAEGAYQAHDHEPWHDDPHDYRVVAAPEIDPGQAIWVPWYCWAARWRSFADIAATRNSGLPTESVQ
jgi:hypothetical protein